MESVKIDPYKLILEAFVSKDPNRRSLISPFIQEEFAIATDASKLIYFKKSLLTEVFFESHAKAPNALAIIPKENNKNISIDAKYLRSLVDESNKLAAETYSQKIQGCPDCHGNGFVDFEFRDWKNKNHEVESECPSCEGDGKIELIRSLKTGQPVYSFKKLIKFGQTAFDTETIESMIKVSELLNEPIVKLVFNTGNASMHKFAIGQCGVCIMPTLNIEDTDLTTKAKEFK